MHSLIQQVEACMHALVVAFPAHNTHLSTMVAYHLQTGGKRLRARLCLETLQTYGVTAEHGVGWAAACEFAHQATLVHDDIQDGDTVRRNRPTVWKQYGVAQAINAGDWLFMLPYLAIDTIPTSDALKWQLSQAIASRMSRVILGQSQEMCMLEHVRIDLEHYIDTVRGKTSALFELPAYGSLLLAGLSSQKAQQQAALMQDFGVLFQINDDVSDYLGQKERDKPAQDLYEGKISIFVVEYCARYPQHTASMLAFLNTPRTHKTEKMIEEIFNEIQQKNILNSVYERMENLFNTLHARIVQETHAPQTEFYIKWLEHMCPMLKHRTLSQ